MVNTFLLLALAGFLREP